MYALTVAKSLTEESQKTNLNRSECEVKLLNLLMFSSIFFLETIFYHNCFLRHSHLNKKESSRGLLPLYTTRIRILIPIALKITYAGFALKSCYIISHFDTVTIYHVLILLCVL